MQAENAALRFARVERNRIASLVPIAVVLCLLGWLGMACHSPVPTDTPAPTTIPTPVRTRAPTPTPLPGSVTEAEAISLIKEELAARGVALDTLRLTIAGQPRWASIRYSSAYAADGSVFQAQMVLVGLAVAPIAARIRPPVDGGVRLSIMPGGESDEGLVVVVIGGSILEAWVNGSLSDEEFVSQWTVGTVTKE